MSPEDYTSAARDLFEAERSGTQTGLLSLRYPDMTLSDAYEVQRRLVDLKVGSGRRIVGHKIGLTSRAMQLQLGIETPDSGVLFDDMEFVSGSVVPSGRFIAPRIECEIIFVMSSDLSGDSVTRSDVLDATSKVCAGLEILDTRIFRRDSETGISRSIVDTISDNAANGGYVMSSSCFSVDEFDLRRIGVILKRDGTVEETGLGAGVLDDPIESVVWLVRRLSGYGMGLSTGDIVLSGSFVRAVEAPPGSSFEADFGDFGVLSLSFA